MLTRFQRNWNFHVLQARMQNSLLSMENSLAFSHKLNHIHLPYIPITLPDIYPKGMKLMFIQGPTYKYL